jgi:hypothetical protein
LRALVGSHGEDAAIHEQLDASHIATLARSKKEYGTGDFIGTTESTEGRERLQDVFFHRRGLREKAAHGRRLDDARGHDVHTDAALLQLGGPGASERMAALVAL